MNKIIAIISTFLIFTGFTSCNENEPLEYSDVPSLYIDNDDMNFSFFYSKSSNGRDTVNIKVHAMGPASEQDRPFILIQTNSADQDAAKEGTHYIAFDSEEIRNAMVMPKRRTETEVPIILLHDKSLDIKTVKLKIGIKPNDNFAAGVIEKDSTVITFSAQALKPSNWDDWYYAFGKTWGSVKMKFIIDNTGITNFDVVPTDTDYLLYLNNKLKNKLEEYNNAHPDSHLSEADGTLIDFENPYIPEY